MCLEDMKGLTDFAVEGIGTLKQVEELSIVHLQEHTSYFAGKIGLGRVDQWVEPLPDHVLLHFGAGASKGVRGKRSLLLGLLLGLLLLLLLLLELHGGGDRCVTDVGSVCELLLSASLRCSLLRCVYNEGVRVEGRLLVIIFIGYHSLSVDVIIIIVESAAANIARTSKEVIKIP